MNCLEFNDRLQKMLDGASVPRDAVTAAHLGQCPACRELDAAARLLTQGLQSLPRLQPSALLTQSIVSAVFDDRRQRVRRVRQRVALTFALAASIVILMIVGWLNQGPQPSAKKMAQLPPPPQEPEAPKLIQRADDARVAVTAWTERVAGQTKEQAKLLLAVANTFDLPPMANLPELSDLQEPLDPAAKSLRQATQTVANGMEPITNSARRAFTFFVKELPVFDIPVRN
jgi:predicted anti-sigma-YlaC factor YlaD